MKPPLPNLTNFAVSQDKNGGEMYGQFNRQRIIGAGAVLEKILGGYQASSCRVRHVNSNNINQSCFDLYSIAINLIPFRCR